MRDKYICDWCLNVINDGDVEVPILILELDSQTNLFCCDDCLNKFIQEFTLEKYVDFNGNID